MSTETRSHCDEVAYWLALILEGEASKETGVLLGLRERAWTNESLRSHLGHVVERDTLTSPEQRLYARMARAAIDDEEQLERLQIIARAEAGFAPQEMADRARERFIVEDVRARVAPILEAMGLEKDARALADEALTPAESVPYRLARMMRREELSTEAFALLLVARRAARSLRDYRDFLELVARVGR